MTLKSSFVEFAKISQNPYQDRMALKPVLIIAHTPYEKKLVSEKSFVSVIVYTRKHRILNTDTKKNSYPEEKSFVSVIV